ncbi:MAG: hypothetical protein K0R31_1153 [Clostridiales bacterium]|jgi:hypothetical protein|nr:hypothetical protein [Clostridiales bacterium]
MIDKKKKYLVNAFVILCAVAFSFPGVISGLGQGGAGNSNSVSLSYSYSSPDYEVEVKDIRNEREIKFINQELDKSKILGQNFPGDREITAQKGSFFIGRTYRGTYEIISSICWYGEKSNICLVQREGKDYLYMEITPALQKFFNKKFLTR